MQTIRAPLALVFALAFASFGCATPLQIKPAEISGDSLPDIRVVEPVAVRATTTGRGKRVLSVAGPNVSVSEDEVGGAIARELTEQLLSIGARVDARADRVIEIEVVRLSLQPDRKIWCVIDFNRRLGEGRFIGLQSRAKSWNYQKACGAAVSQAVLDTLKDPAAVAYLAGE